MNLIFNIINIFKINFIIFLLRKFKSYFQLLVQFAMNFYTPISVINFIFIVVIWNQWKKFKFKRID